MTFNSLKTLAAASLIALASGTAAFAAGMSYNYIIPGTYEHTNSVINLDLVRADNGGTVSIYDFTDGTQGALLGSEMVHAGANENVKVQLQPNVAQKALVVLSVDGMAPVATATISDFNQG
ncbi:MULTISPECIES: hypothetical protein [Roseobacteraceae]|jgi:hypothetical protein|uniref:Uncharacterized protein n=1 Tax=Celeribacter baekdonensis B30 TaxID=1208323 RepID=K2JN25_9RHOB|nr:MULTISPECIES: hypothetical protein [Roseobacteraceae]EKE71909.1 hypothetical protein B30_09073 [Celeribacter baekdonensis B30]KAB6715253.1 hypothetical protein C8029_15720 [Roseobacter sp. TSBP12]|tara:strand:+ start:2453 stop:2815 length:363 start_codon:yes stop_codon:yes gene_type:complete